MASSDRSENKHLHDAEHHHGNCCGGSTDLKRRGAVRTTLSALLAGIGALALGSLAPKTAQASGGACCKCDCRAFEGSTYQCTNCGHQWADHGCMR